MWSYERERFNQHGFLQFSTNKLMVAGTPNSWQAIDSPDSDPLAEPPDEVVALLDREVVDDLKASQHAHNERVRRARNRFALPAPPSAASAATPADGACWWRVVHEPAVHVRAAPSMNATSIGVKLAGERVYGMQLLREEWLRVHAPTDAHDEGWMLVDGHALGFGTLLQRCAAMLGLVDDDGEEDWERLVAERGDGDRQEALLAGQQGDDDGGVATHAENLGERPNDLSAHVAPTASFTTDITDVAMAASAGIAAERATKPTADQGAVDMRSMGDSLAADVTDAASAEPAPAAAVHVASGDGHSATRLKSLGDAAFRTAQYGLAAERYSEALAAVAREGGHAKSAWGANDGLSLEAVLLCNRSAARRLARQMPGAVSDASLALDLAPTYTKAALRHGVALLESGDYLRARAAFEHFLRLDGGWLAFPWLQRCRTRLAADAGRSGVGAVGDLYALLDVPCDCSNAVLRQAYKRRSLQCHPDRQGTAAAFQQLQTAFETLRDPQVSAGEVQARVGQNVTF